VRARSVDGQLRIHSIDERVEQRFEDDRDDARTAGTAGDTLPNSSRAVSMPSTVPGTPTASQPLRDRCATALPFASIKRSRPSCMRISMNPCDVSAARIDDRERVRHCDRSIDGVPPAPQNVGAGLRRIVLLGRHHRVRPYGDGPGRGRRSE
jgi:hypothetical protein